MRALLLDAPRTPLRLAELPVPEPSAGQIRVRVRACGVCRTDLHIADGELAAPRLPLILGHEVAGTVDALGRNVERFSLGDRVGIPWLGAACGKCASCRRGRENLCDDARFTGYHLDGGYAEYALCEADFCFALPEGYGWTAAAPLMCAGLIGYRALRAAGDADPLGLYGFGGSAHIVAQVARHEGRRVFAFTRLGDVDGQEFARSLGVVWAGDSSATPPEALGAAIIFAPVGSLVPAALRAVEKGGTVICAGIHMSDIPAFPYALLWGERVLRSIANLTRQDGREFLELARRVPLHTATAPYPLERADDALTDLRSGKLRGAAVLQVVDT